MCCQAEWKREAVPDHKVRWDCDDRTSRVGETYLGVGSRCGGEERTLSDGAEVESVGVEATIAVPVIRPGLRPRLTTV